MHLTTTVEKGWTTEGDLEQMYYYWLTSFIPKWIYPYSCLIRLLYDTPFRVTLLMDENRVGDGLGMRTRFTWENHMGIIERDILKQARPCSVLEVMIGLAHRFEEEYMTQYDQDDNFVERWFGAMINSLGLSQYNDENFNITECSQIIENFLQRDYSPDGRGSLFYIPGINVDMRQMEIWQQLLAWNNR